MCYARWGMKEIFTLFRHKIYYYCLISFEKLSLPNKITVYMITFIIKESLMTNNVELIEKEYKELLDAALSNPVWLM